MKSNGRLLRLVSVVVAVVFFWINCVWAGGVDYYKLSVPSQVTALVPLADAFGTGQQVVKNLIHNGVVDKDAFYRELGKGRISTLSGVSCLVFSDKDDTSRLAYYVFNPSENYFSRITTHQKVADSLWNYLNLIGINKRALPGIREFRENDTTYYQRLFVLNNKELDFIDVCLRNVYPDWEIKGKQETKQEISKQAAACEAVKLISDGMVVGLGSGITMYYALKEIARKVREEGLVIIGIPTSEETERICRAEGIPISTLHKHPIIDLAIDGADEIGKRSFYMIKGGGGALTDEKRNIASAKKVVIIADSSKIVDGLGERHPIYIEVKESEKDGVIKKLEELGAEVMERRGFRTYKRGNIILHARFKTIDNPVNMEEKLNLIRGVVENGIFTRVPDEVIVAKGQEITKFHPNRRVIKKEIKKVLLLRVYPLDSPFDVRLPLGLAYLYSSLRQEFGNNIEVDVLDMATQPKDFDLMHYISKNNYDLIGISTISSIYGELADEIAKGIRDISPNSLVVTGGVHASTSPKRIIGSELYDAVFVRDGEVSLCDFIVTVSDGDGDISKVKGIWYISETGQICFTGEPIYVDLDKVDLMKGLDIFNFRDYDFKSPYFDGEDAITLFTSRGCPYRCSFCCVRSVSGTRYRSMSVNDLIRLLKKIVKKHGIKNFNFDNDVFTLNRKYMMELCNAIMAESDLKGIKWKITTRADLLDREMIGLMYKAGVRYIAVAPEIADQGILDRVNKKIELKVFDDVVPYARRLGIKIRYFLMLGLPGITERSVLETVKLIQRTEPDESFVAIEVPYPGTDIGDHPELFGVDILVRDLKRYWMRDNRRVSDFGVGTSEVEDVLVKTQEMDVEAIAIAREALRNALSRNPLMGLIDPEVKRYVIEFLISGYGQLGIEKDSVERMIQILCLFQAEPEKAIQRIQSNIPCFKYPDGKFYVNYRQYRAGTRYPWVASLFPKDLLKGRILDIGCGNNSVGKFVVENYPGVESFIGIDVVRYPDLQDDNPHLHFIKMDNQTELYVQDSSIDTAFIVYTLHHVDFEEQREILRNLYKKLKPGGKVLILEDAYSESVPPGSDVNNLIDKFLNLSIEQRDSVLRFSDWLTNSSLIYPGIPREVPVPGCFRTLEEWIGIFKESEFVIEESEFMGVYPERTHHVPACKFILGKPDGNFNKGVNPAILSVSKGDGVKIKFESMEKHSVSVTPAWHMAGWEMCFAQLAPGQMLSLNQNSGKNYVKVITGELVNIGQGAFVPIKQKRSTLVKEEYIQAGDEGAIVAVMVKADKAPESIRNMDQVRITGPLSEYLSWKACEEYQWGEPFKDMPFYNLRGFRIIDDKGKDICYVQFWAAGKGVNCGMHDHSETDAETTFCEIHLGLFNGTGSGGMVSLDVNGNEVFLPIREGEEHGPFWEIDMDTGRPLRRENGAVSYGMHRWQAGGERAGREEEESFDVWAVFEMVPDEAVLDSICWDRLKVLLTEFISNYKDSNGYQPEELVSFFDTILEKMHNNPKDMPNIVSMFNSLDSEIPGWLDEILDIIIISLDFEKEEEIFNIENPLLRRLVDIVVLIASHPDKEIAKAGSKLLDAMIYHLHDTHFVRERIILYKILIQVLQGYRIWHERLDEHLTSFGLRDEKDMIERIKRVRQPHQIDKGKQIRKVFIFGRGPVGGDVNLSSVVLQKVKRIIRDDPEAKIIFAGDRNLEKIFGGDPSFKNRIRFVDLSYKKLAVLSEKIELCFMALKILDDNGYSPEDSIVIDIGSHMLLHGVMPLTRDEGNYFYFEMATQDSTGLGEHIDKWSNILFGIPPDTKPVYASINPEVKYIDMVEKLLKKCGLEDRYVIALTFGTGGDKSKQISTSFEVKLIKAIMDEGADIVMSKGGSEEERRKAEEIAGILAEQGIIVKDIKADEVDSMEPLPPSDGRMVIMMDCSFGELAALIAKSRQLVCYSSSPKHIAGALGIPVTVIYVRGEKVIDKWMPYTQSPVGVVRITPEEKKNEEMVLERVLELVRRLRPPVRIVPVPRVQASALKRFVKQEVAEQVRTIIPRDDINDIPFTFLFNGRALAKIASFRYKDTFMKYLEPGKNEIIGRSVTMALNSAISEDRDKAIKILREIGIYAGMGIEALLKGTGTQFGMTDDELKAAWEDVKTIIIGAGVSTGETGRILIESIRGYLEKVGLGYVRLIQACFPGKDAGAIGAVAYIMPEIIGEAREYSREDMGVISVDFGRTSIGVKLYIVDTKTKKLKAREDGNIEHYNKEIDTVPVPLDIYVDERTDYGIEEIEEGIRLRNKIVEQIADLVIDTIEAAEGTGRYISNHGLSINIGMTSPGLVEGDGLIGNTRNLSFFRKQDGFIFAKEVEKKVREKLNGQFPFKVHLVNDGYAAGIGNILFDARIDKIPGNKIGYLGPGSGLGSAVCCIEKDIKHVAKDNGEISSSKERWGARLLYPNIPDIWQYGGRGFSVQPRWVPESTKGMAQVIGEDELMRLVLSPGWKVVITRNYDEMTYAALYIIVNLMEKAEAEFCFGLATGGTTESLRKAMGLIDLSRQILNGLSVPADKIKLWETLDNYYWPMGSDPRTVAIASYFQEQNYMLLEPLYGEQLGEDRFIAPPDVTDMSLEETALDFYRRMRIFMNDAYRILVQLHGIGSSGHDAFNEVFMRLKRSEQRVITDLRRYVNIPEFEKVPSFYYGMGLMRPDHATICLDITRVQNIGHIVERSFHPFFLRFMADNLLYTIPELLDRLSTMGIEEISTYYPEPKYRFISEQDFISELQYLLDNYKLTPRLAITQGTGDIALRTGRPDSLNLFMVSSPHKQELLRRAVDLKPSASCTASWLQLAANAIVVATEDSAGAIDWSKCFLFEPNNKASSLCTEAKIEGEWEKTKPGERIQTLIKGREDAGLTKDSHEIPEYNFAISKIKELMAKKQFREKEIDRFLDEVIGLLPNLGVVAELLEIAFEYLYMVDGAKDEVYYYHSSLIEGLPELLKIYSTPEDRARILNGKISDLKEELSKEGRDKDAIITRNIFSWLARANEEVYAGGISTDSFGGYTIKVMPGAKREIVSFSIEPFMPGGEVLMEEWYEYARKNNMGFRVPRFYEWQYAIKGLVKGFKLVTVDVHGRKRIESWVTYEEVVGEGIFELYRENAPWNGPHVKDREIKGAATAVLKRVIEESVLRGYNGRLISIASIKEGETFAQRVGRKPNYTPKTQYGKVNWAYWTLSPFAAKRFLEKYQRRYISAVEGDRFTDSGRLLLWKDKEGDKYIELWEVEIKDGRLGQGQILPAGKRVDKLNEKILIFQDVLTLLSSDEYYGPGILAVIDAIRVVDNISVDRLIDWPVGQLTSLVKEGDKNILLLDVDAFNNVELLSAVLLHGLISSIMSIIPCESDEAKRMVADYISLKYVEEMGIPLDDTKMQRLFRQFSFGEELMDKIRGAENRCRVALQVFNEIADAKNMAGIVRETEDLTIRVIKTFTGVRIQGLDKLSKKLAGLIAASVKIASKKDEIASLPLAMTDDRYYIVVDKERIPEGMKKEWNKEIAKLQKNDVFNVVYSLDDLPKGHKPENVIHLIDPADINEEMPQDILYLPMPYLRSSLYMAAAVVVAKGEVDKVNPLVKGLISDLYSQILGREVSREDLERLFKAPWLLLPEIRSVLAEINNLRKALVEIEKAA